MERVNAVGGARCVGTVALVVGCLHCSSGPPAGTQDTTSDQGTSTSSGNTTDSGTNLQTSATVTTGVGGTGSGMSTGSGGSTSSGGTSSATVSVTGSSGMGGSGTSGTTGSMDGTQVAGDHCSFTVDHSQSSAIGTVTIVNWSTDLAELTEAAIDFGLAGAEPTLTAPVNLARTGYRTLLLGMKAGHDYSFRIRASTTSVTCTSPDFSVVTGAVPDNVPVITKETHQAGGAEGFYLTTPGIGASPRGYPGAYIFDADGDVVWWTPEPVEHQSSARMSWDGQWLWYVNANGGVLHRTSMDGLTTQTFGVANHDIAPLPEGGVATFTIMDGESSLIEVADDGSVTEIAAIEDLYQNANHPNALVYYPGDNSFTMSDLDLDGFVKLTRGGDLVWQLGGLDPMGSAFSLVGMDAWDANHGHELGPDGRFLFFNNTGASDVSVVMELELDESNWTANKVWEWELPVRNDILGGCQRLPNGNTAVVSSMSGVLYEVTPAGEVVQTFDNSHSFATKSALDAAIFGYARYRPTLYGPPISTWPTE